MRNIALVVDDEEINREILKEILKDDFSVMEAENGAEAVRLLDQHRDEIAVMLLDLVMPEMDGIAVLKTLGERGFTSIPVLVASGEQSDEVEERCLAYGAADFIRKPLSARAVRKRVKNTAEFYQYREHLEEIVREQTLELTRRNAKLQQINNDIIDLLGNVVEARNFESGAHVKRVKGYTAIIADAMKELYPEYGLTEETNAVIVSASALHDVGKIMISDAVLLKPGRLTAEEFDYMKKHTVFGCEMLKDMDKIIQDEEYSRVCYDICRHHHEKWDGRGYPDGLAGDDIPIAAQIVSLADVYDALITERVYKKAFSKPEAFRMINAGECGQFSPKILRCFAERREEMESLSEKQDKAE